MNSYGGLQTEKTDNEIQTENQFRNTKKKLKKKEKKYQKEPSEELKLEIRKIQIAINEYTNKSNPRHLDRCELIT